MTDVYADFLDQMEEKEDYARGGGGIVREIKIEIGWHGYEKGCGHDFWKYWRPFNLSDKEERKEAFLSSQKTLRQDKLKKIPAKAIKVTIWNPGKNENRDLYPIWAEDKYAIMSNSIVENKLPLYEKFWSFLAYTPDTSKEKVEYEGKWNHPNMKIPVRIFANEEESMAFIEANQPVQPGSNGYSDMAMTNFQSVETLELNSEEILGHLVKAMSGEKIMGKELPDNLQDEESIKRYVADIWDIEPSDIDILESKEIAF